MTTLDEQLIEQSQKGDSVRVKELLENGADVNAKNNYTALHWSAYWGHTDVVRVLLEHGTDVNAKDNIGWTALHWSARYGKTEVVRVLLEHGANQSELFKKWDKQQIVKEFLEINNCNPDKKHTNELCSVSFEPVKNDDWYVVWEDDSVSILENVHLVSVEPELIKNIYIQC